MYTFTNYYKYVFIVILLVLPFFGVSNHNCNYKITGLVIDAETKKEIESANITISNVSAHTLSNQNGIFEFSEVCAGHYHIEIYRIGYQTEEIILNVETDTLVKIALKAQTNQLNTIIVNDNLPLSHLPINNSISSDEIIENAEKSFAEQLETINGVSILKTGSNISKPIVHGLFGNRLNILNNGILHSGQQWGNDHSPEIDPLSSSKISMIEGVQTLEYPGSNLGAIILTESNKIGNEKRIHGRFNYTFEQNGIGNGINIQLKQYTSFIAWKFNGTLKKRGDKNTPNYYLRNTGSEEANFSIQLEKLINDKWSIDLFFSSFNTNIAILRGAHIGNLNDLYIAFNQTIPFYTQDNFSYEISAPKQSVNHHLLKIQSNYFINDNQWFQVQLAGQINSRKEFDIRRNNRTERPALSLFQYTGFLSTKYYHKTDNNWLFKTGLQINIIDNTNVPETGILPLMPDYQSFRNAAFVTFSKQINQTLIEGGIRYENIYQEVLDISQSFPREIIRYKDLFHNVSSIVGIHHKFSEALELKYNLGYIRRNPAINELYANGLHQGVSSIEEGDVNLKTEAALKNTLTFKLNIKNRFELKLQGYHHYFNNFIYLQVQPKPRVTIRGTFPVFIYQQDDVQIYGFDVSTFLRIINGFDLLFSYSYLRGEHIYESLPLVYMPPNNISGSLSYSIPKPIKLGKRQLENTRIVFNNRYIFKQNNLLEEQDIVAPPPGYFLMSFNLSSELQLKDIRICLSLKLENALNTTYRDYLNRQRYYADEPGINLISSLKIQF
ncbi:TonB-dependent receptor [Aureispira]|nr:TonB-dependent receptor [Aureispira sp.]